MKKARKKEIKKEKIILKKRKMRKLIGRKNEK
jgi:hypothetical protein